MESKPNLPGTAYFIDGFRSLRNFSLTLQPGINAIVGPNGSGKTNFLDFLGFLDTTVHAGAITATSDAGGLARVFSQENTTRKAASLVARISGVADLRDTIPTPVEVGYCKFIYEYEVVIKFSRAHSLIYISDETLKLRKLYNDDGDPAKYQIVGTIQLARRSPNIDGMPRWKTGRWVFANNKRNPMAQTDPIYANQKLKLKERFGTPALNPDQSLLSVGSRYAFPAIEAVRSAITKGRSFNIFPDKARAPDDISRPGGIARDGSGLTSTLHALQLLRRPPRRRLAKMRRATKNTLDEVVEWTKLVFSELQDITTTQDPHTGKYLTTLVIKSPVPNDPPLRLSLQSASDGTIKWLSLVILILAGGGIYSLEEPENFLHPRMQQFLVQIIRDSLDEDSVSSYFLFSTHSETLINHCKPEELVIFEFCDNSTLCHRIENPALVLEEINRTGFGLGYYYANNSLPQNTRVR